MKIKALLGAGLVSLASLSLATSAQAQFDAGKAQERLQGPFDRMGCADLDLEADASELERAEARQLKRCMRIADHLSTIEAGETPELGKRGGKKDPGKKGPGKKGGGAELTDEKRAELVERIEGRLAKIAEKLAGLEATEENADKIARLEKRTERLMKRLDKLKSQ